MKMTVSVNKQKDTNGNQTSEQINLQAVYSDDPNSENRKWSQATPAGSLSATINNPGAFGALDGVKEAYVDIYPAD